MKSIRKNLTIILALLAVLTMSLGLILMPKSNTSVQAAVNTESGFYIEDSASIRLVENQTGIKWRAHLTKDKFEAMQTDNNGTITEFGIRIKPRGLDNEDQWVKYPYWTASVATPTFNWGEQTEVVFNRSIYYDELIQDIEAKLIASGVLAQDGHLSETEKEQYLRQAYTTNLVAEPYAIVTPTEGEAKLVPGESFDSDRSVQGVALYHVVNGTYADDESILNTLYTFLPVESVTVNDSVFEASDSYYSNVDAYGEIAIDAELQSIVDGGAKIYYGAKEVEYEAGIATLTNVDTLITTDGKVNDYLMIFDETSGIVYKQYFVGVTLAIDQASDMNYFQLKKDFTYNNHIYNFADGDFQWDGYYVLLNDIDGAGATHDFLNGRERIVYVSLSDIENNTYGNTVACGFQDGNGNYNRGLLGTFDGRGYSIKNFTLDTYGSFFGAIFGGTVKDVAFINNGYQNEGTLASMISGGAKIQNVYVESTNLTRVLNMRYGAIASELGTVSMDNVVVYGVYSGGLDTGVRTYPTNASALGAPYDKSLLDLSNVLIISTLQISNHRDSNATEWTVIADAEVINGNENTAENAVAGVKRYDTYADLEADLINNDFSSWSRDTWEVIDGIPYFLNTVTGDYTAYLNGVEIIANSSMGVVEGDQFTATIKIGDRLISTAPQVEVIDGADYVSASGATITANAESGANPVKVKISYRGNSWVQEFEVFKNITPTTHSGEFYFSAYHGKFYDTNFNVVSVDDIFGADVDVVRAYDSDGNALSLTATDEVMGLDLGKQTTWTDTSLTLYTAEEGLIIDILGADVIIKDATDFNYFTLDGAINYDSAITYTNWTKNDWIWDGYHVVVNDIDASTTPHTTSTDVTGNLFNATIAQIKATNFGLSGVFDGQGYTISNLGIDGTGDRGPGLFTFINGGIVKNVAFENLYSSHKEAPGSAVTTSASVASPFANALVNGGKVEDVYLSTFLVSANRAWRFIISAESGTEVSRVVIQDNYKKNTNWGGYIIGSDFNATMTDVYVIAENPLTYGAYNAITNAIDKSSGSDRTIRYAHEASFDAKYVDDVENTTGKHNYIYNAVVPNNNYGDEAYSDVAYDLTTGNYYTSANAVIEPYSITLRTGVKRYTTLANMQNAVNNDFSSWNSDLWKVVDGVPYIISTFNSKADVLLNGEAIVDENTITLNEGDQISFSATFNGEAYSGIPIVQALKGGDFVSIDTATATLTANTQNDDNVIEIKVSIGGKSYTQFIVIYGDTGITATPASEEYYFSVHDGKFYNKTTYDVVSIENIFGSTVEITQAYVQYVTDGELIPVSVVDGAITGVDLGARQTWAEIYFTLYTADAGIIITVEAADLIIDNTDDFSYFTLTGIITWNTSSVSYTANDWNWDGYHVLAKDIDATKYNHTTTSTATGNVDQMTLAGFESSEYGFKGVFDGQGHTITNLGVDGVARTSPGLFTIVNGGTIKNLAFDNIYSSTNASYIPNSDCTKTSASVCNPFVDALVNGGTIQDVYLGYHKLNGTRNWRLFQTSSSNASVTRVVIQDNSLQNSSHQPSNYGSYLFSSSSEAQLSQVYLISGVAVTTSTSFTTIYAANSTTKISAISVVADAYMVDGVEYGEVGATTANYNYYHNSSSKYGTKYDVANDSYYSAASNGGTKKAPYSINKIFGIKRYTTVAKMQEFEASNVWTDWNTSIWNINGGAPKFVTMG